MFEVKSFISHFTELEDPRISGLVTYPLNEILLCALCGIICRSSDWEEISCWGKYHIKWLRKFLPFKSGIPRPNTFARVFNALDSKQFKCCFEGWVNIVL